MATPRRTARSFRIRVARDPVIIVAFTIAALSACAAIIQAIYKSDFLLPTLLVAAATLLGALAKALPIWREEHKHQRELEAGVHLNDRGQLPIAMSADLTEVFGVHKGIDSSLPYIYRGQEHEVHSLLTARRPVLLVGPPLGGKTRTAAEALRRVAGGLPVWSWKDPTTVAAHLEEKIPHGAAIWFDQLDRYLLVGAIDAVRMTLLAEGNLVVATMEQSVYESIVGMTQSAQGRALVGDAVRRVKVEAVMAMFTVVFVPNETPEGLKRLVAHLPRQAARDQICLIGGIGVYMAGGTLAAARYAYLFNNHPYTYGLVRAAVDWQRTKIGQSIPRDTARRLAIAYAASGLLVKIGSPGPANERQWRKHERRAEAWLSGRGSAQLIAGSQDLDIHRWTPFLSLKDLAVKDDPRPQIIRETWVEAARASATNLEIFEAAYEAQDAAEYDIAIQLFLKIANDDRSSVFTAIGFVYTSYLDDPTAAELWLRKAADHGEVNAMVLLGKMLQERAPEDATVMKEAKAIFQRAAALGEPNAMFFLAVMAPTRKQKRWWFRAGAEKNHISSMAGFGALLGKEPGQEALAEDYLRRSAEAGDSNGQTSLGCFLLHHDRVVEACPWLELGAAAGDVHAMNDLGRLLIDEDLVLAEHWLRKGAERGYVPSMTSLGAVIFAHLPDEAEIWFRKAATRGSVQAMRNLASSLHLRKPQEAEEWWQKAEELDRVARGSLTDWIPQEMPLDLSSSHLSEL